MTFNVQETIQDIITTKLNALQSKNIQQYMSTVTSTDNFYQAEQRRWFNEMISDEISNLSIAILNIVQKDNGDIVAEIRQKHKCVEDFDFEYPLLFKYESGVLKDCGCYFKIIKTPEYTIKYLGEGQKVSDFQGIVDDCIKSAENHLHMKLKHKLEFKLFDDAEILRQRTAPTIKWKFYAWGDPDESLKYWTEYENFDFYNDLIQHEIIHILTLPICDSKAPSWLCEGIATWYSSGNGEFYKKDNELMKAIDSYNLEMPLDKLEEISLYSLSDMKQISEYYFTCGAYYGYLDEKYGLDLMLEVFSRWPEHGRTTLNDTLGISDEEITAGYKKWVKDKLKVIT